MIINTFSDVKDTEQIGNAILGAIQAVGTVISVAMLMILGIKYMMGSIEERASYKKSMLPYFIGGILLFGAVNLTAAIYDVVQIDDQAYIDAMKFINNHKDDLDAIHTEAQDAKRRAIKEEQIGLLDKETIEELRRYGDILYDYWNTHRERKDDT